MNLIFTQKQAREKIEGLEARIEELEADALAKEEGIETLQTELATAREDLAAKQSRIEELESKASKVEELETKVQEAEQKIEAAENSAAQKAVELAAEAGHEEAIPVVESEQINHLAVFNSLKGAERTAYYKKHQHQIRKGL